MSRIMENLNFFYEMFISEYEKAKTNLKNYYLTINEINDIIKNNELDQSQFLIFYDEAMENYSITCDVIRKFNIQVELATQKLKPIMKTVQVQREKCTAIPTNKPDKPAENIEHFPRSDMSLYNPDFEGECIISYVKNASQKLFYILDVKSKLYLDGVLTMEQFFDKNCEELAALPQAGIVFGYYADMYMFRAVCEPYDDNTKVENIKIYLMDVGETVTHTPSVSKLYALPEKYQKIPAQALLCKLIKVKDCANTDPETFLRKNLYVKQRFKILKIEDHVLHVNLYSTNPFVDNCSISSSTSSETDKTSVEYPLSNPFHQFRCRKRNNMRQKENVLNSTAAETNIGNISPDFTKNEINELCDDIRGTKINNMEMTVVPYAHTNYPSNQPQKYFAPCNNDRKYYNNSKNFELPKTTNEYYNATKNNYKTLHATSIAQQPQPLIYNYNNITSTYPPLPAISDVPPAISIPSAHPTSSIPSINNNYFISKPPVMYAGNSTNRGAFKKMKSINKSPPEISNYPNVQSIDNLNDTVEFSPPKQQQQCNLTPEQINMLYEEPLTTENAMEAVMGYDPQDDKRICKFYDPSINGCFKGSNCNKLHIPKLDEGWTKDKMPTKIAAKGETSFPAIGSTVTVVPVHVRNVEIFYAHIPDQNEIYQTSLKEIVLKMNSSEIKSKYVKFTKPPVELELVLGLYTDHHWYRAKVINVIDDDAVKVFYVDFGNCQILPLDKIRKWDDRFDYFPFQAVSCKLYNVLKIKEFHAEAIDYLKKLILSKHFSAKVIDNEMNLCVTLMDEDGFDIGELLCASGYATFNPITETSGKKKENKMIPA